MDLIQVVEKACKDSSVKSHLETAFDDITKGYDLTEEEKQALKTWVEEEVLV